MGKRKVDRCLDTRPKKVAIVALGASFVEYCREMFSMKGARPPFDEVWTVNRGISVIRHDKCFMMDDFRWIENKDQFYAERVKWHDKPVITSTVYPEYPMAVRYPLEAVVNKIGDDFLNNTVAYMVGYAILVGVEELSIYGADFFYPNLPQWKEEGGQCVAYLLGIGRKFGMSHRIPGTSTLLSANTARVDERDGVVRRKLYGYHRKDESNKGKGLAEDAARARQSTHQADSPLGGRSESVDNNQTESLRKVRQTGGTTFNLPKGEGLRGWWTPNQEDTSLVLGAGGNAEQETQRKVRNSPTRKRKTNSGGKRRASRSKC